MRTDRLMRPAGGFIHAPPVFKGIVQKLVGGHGNGGFVEILDFYRVQRNIHHIPIRAKDGISIQSPTRIRL